MDYRHSIRFTAARVMNRLLFSFSGRNTIPVQYAITRRLLPKPTGSAIVPTKDGILLKLDITADSGTQLQGSIDRNLYYLGTYEIATTELIRKFLKTDGVFIDVGSHNGSLALFASNVAKNGQVIAFEPVLALQERLQENIDLNHAVNVKPVQVALGAKKSKLTININHNNRGSSSLRKNSKEVYVEQEVIDVDTLDDQVKQLGLARVDMVKVDVEGFEVEVLKGAKNTIQEYRPYLIIEHDPKNIKVREPFDLITKLGIYKLYIPKNGRHVKGPLVQIYSYDELPKSYVTNFLCMPSEGTR